MKQTDKSFGNLAKTKYKKRSWRDLVKEIIHLKMESKLTKTRKLRCRKQKEKQRPDIWPDTKHNQSLFRYNWLASQMAVVIIPGTKERQQ